MKKVYSCKSDVCHLWAHNTQSEAVAGNVSFYNGRLKSYYTCIGQRFEVDGSVIFVVNDYTFSSSTSSHQNCMLSSIPKHDKNVHVFHINRNVYGDRYLVSRWDYNNKVRQKEFREDLVSFAFRWISDIWNECLDVKYNNGKNTGVDLGKFNKFLDFISVTKCKTLSGYMRMTEKEMRKELYISEFHTPRGMESSSKVRKIKKFLRVLSDKKSTIEDIIDCAAGKGTYSAYLERSKPYRFAEKLRRISELIGFKLNKDAWYSKNVIVGKITAKEYRKRKADGTLIKWMLEQKRTNMEAIRTRDENRRKKEVLLESKYRLELHIGYTGWNCEYNRELGRTVKRSFTSFDYDGHVFQLDNRYKTTSLPYSEYIAFRQMSKEEQDNFIHEKRRYMLEYLMDYKERLNNLEREKKERIAEASRLRMLRELHKKDVEEAIRTDNFSKLRELWYIGAATDYDLPYGRQLLYHGGNVLLKVSGDYVVSSKNIRVTKFEARRMWRVIKMWHDRKMTFAPNEESFHATYGSYEISRYENDILIAGCHAISYFEMERIAKELGFDKEEIGSVTA